jgi:hypothetical protein
MPYVYLCTHKETGEFYYGYREHNVSLSLTSTEDFPSYRTSSKIVNPNFDQYDWYIVAEFFDGLDAFEFEQHLISENWGNPLMLNKQYRKPNGNAAFKGFKGNNKGRKNPSLSERNRTSVPWNKGLTKDDPRVAKNANSPSQKRKDDFSKLMTEWHKTHDTSGENNPMFGVKRKRVVCEHCGKEIDDANYSRWHGAKCKLAP